jgi:hypothetical protein
LSQIALIGCLKPGARREALALIEQGAPFDLASAGFDRHSVFLSDREVVFVFEGPDVEWELDDITSDAFHPALQEAFASWRPLVEGEPRVARGVFHWDRKAL